MLEKILSYSNLGNKSQILYIISLLSKGDFTRDDLFKTCSTQEYTYSNSFNGIIALLLWLKVIKEKEVISFKKTFSEINFIEKFIILLFSKLSEEKELHNFINSTNMVYDPELQSICIKNYLIKLKYSSIRNLLINIGLLENDILIKNQFVIAREFIKLFTDTIIPLIEKSQIRNLSFIDFKELHAKQIALGFEAELFVLNYEKKKRANHLKSKNIQIISEIDSSAGYDILSYKSDNSFILDKYIEVKSFSGNESFFWSRNEIDVAKIKENEYFLYLVDRTKMNNDGYEPIIIQNPYEHVLNNEQWSKRIEKYYLSRIEY